MLVSTVHNTILVLQEHKKVFTLSRVFFVPRKINQETSNGIFNVYAYHCCHFLCTYSGKYIKALATCQNDFNHCVLKTRMGAISISVSRTLNHRG